MAYESDTINDTLQEIHATLREINKKSSFGEGLTWIILVIFGWLGAAGLWHSDTRYVLQYGVAYSQITHASRPDDCSFLRSPIGWKDCHYKRVVSAVRVGTNQWGGQSISYDDGKTWIQRATSKAGGPIESDDGGRTWFVISASEPVSPQVVISWEKEDGD